MNTDTSCFNIVGSYKLAGARSGVQTEGPGECISKQKIGGLKRWDEGR